jgi:hypothetical protein
MTTGETVMEWNLTVLFLRESWSVSFRVKGTELGYWPANVFDFSRVNYTKWNNVSNEEIFPKTWLNVVTPPPLPPTPYIEVVNGGRDLRLNWSEPHSVNTRYYLIYRAENQTGFDFSTPWMNTTKDVNPLSGIVEPLRREWLDLGAGDPDDRANFRKEYYYIVRTVNVDEDRSFTSRTVGKWTKTFPQGVSTFSLPLEPLDNFDIDWYTSNMNAVYIKYMNITTHRWVQHNFGDGSKNNTQMKLGEGYEVKFDSQTTFTFTGMPGAMISYDEVSLGFDATAESGDAQNLIAWVNGDGNVILFWIMPENTSWNDTYWVIRSEKRDGFWGTEDVDYEGIYCVSGCIPGAGYVFLDSGIAKPGTEYYYMIVPINGTTGERGVSSYSVGVWTEEYWEGYDTFGIPLKLNYSHTADWYCDSITHSVGINYYNITFQEWWWHSTVMAKKAFDPVLKMTEGYQISTSNVTKFTFIGV